MYIYVHFMRKEQKRELDYLLKEKLYKQIPDLADQIHQRRFTIKDVGVTHRWITNWDKKGLLFYEYEPEKWRKFDLIEYIWLKMVVQMRQFRVPLDTIKNLRDFLKTNAMNTDDEAVQHAMQRVAEAGVNDDNPDKDAKSAVDETLASDEFKAVQGAIHISFLEAWTLDAIVFKNHSAILVNPEGNWMHFKEAYIDYYKTLEDFNEFYRRSHISISLSQILAEFISTKDLNLVHGELGMIREAEMQVLQALRSEDIKSVKINLDSSNKINLIEISEDKKVDKSTTVGELIMNGGYQDITIKIQNGRTVYCENIWKEKI